MRRSREGVDRISSRYREGRLAMARISRELQSAYLSVHEPIDESLKVVATSFVGEPGSPAARLDFNSFSHRRLRADARESDQVEISYFGSEDPDEGGVVDLARRVAPPDLEPRRGGKVEVLATDIDLFDLKYLDPLTGQWREEWDSTSVVGEKGRMPAQVKITLVLNGAARSRSDSSRGKIRLVSKIPILIQDSLNFALK
jgi:general secretion pathway protein J